MQALYFHHVCFHNEVSKKDAQLPAVDEIPEDPEEITCVGLHRRTRAGANGLILEFLSSQVPISSMAWLTRSSWGFLESCWALELLMLTSVPDSQ